jgi:hypothetical protein
MNIKLITKVIDPHSEYVILIAFERQHCLDERAASLRFYVNFHSCYTVFPYSTSLCAEYHHVNNTHFNVPLNFVNNTNSDSLLHVLPVALVSRIF